MRSPKEILFRLKQEAGNAWCLFSPPRWNPDNPNQLRSLWPRGSAVAAALGNSVYANNVADQADRLLAGELPLLGYSLRFPDPLVWNKDLVHGQQSPNTWFRRLPYLNFDQVGDHKVIWELSRHQYLMLVTQAWLLQPKPEYLAFVEKHLTSWLDENPYGKGINWTSALEVAFRALSWLWILHWTELALPEPLRRRLLDALYGHGVFLELNLSHYFSPNTHLLGEAIALYCIGAMLPESPRSESWQHLGATVTEAELENQVRADGSHFEQSSSYHVYVVDFFLFYGLTAEAAGRSLPGGFRAKLKRSATYLHQLLGPGRTIPLLGDDDGGRLFHPFGQRNQFGRASLAACTGWFPDAGWPVSNEDSAQIAAWWFGPKAMQWPATGAPAGSHQLFPDAAVALLQNSPFEDGPIQAVVDARAFGFGGAGHSHAGALALVLRAGEEEILLDSGTYTYISDVAQRNRFRGTAAHNTIAVGNSDQATTSGPFRWLNLPTTQVLAWNPEEGLLRAEVRVAASSSHEGYRHERTVQKLPGQLRIDDLVEAGSQERSQEQPVSLSWHFPAAPTAVPNALDKWQYTLDDGMAFTMQIAAQGGETLEFRVEPSERSLCLGSKQACFVLRAVCRVSKPVQLRTTITWDRNHL